MMLRLVINDEPTINVGNMKDGDVAVIVIWAASTDEYKGRIVQRCGHALHTLGSSSDRSFGIVFNSPRDWMSNNQHRVRILKEGETLVVDGPMQ